MYCKDTICAILDTINNAATRHSVLCCFLQQLIVLYFLKEAKDERRLLDTSYHCKKQMFILSTGHTRK